MANANNCSFCSSPSVPYTCPKCQAHYCSSACYKHPDHSRCSEDFYKDQVMLELGTSSASGQSQQKMVEVLKRLHSEEEQSDMCLNDDTDEDSNDESWQDRFGNINLDDADAAMLWNKLTPGEQDDFTMMVKQNRVHEFVTHWNPWWTQKEPIIQELNSDTYGVSKEIDGTPKLSELLRNGNPSSLVCYNILNILYAYVAVCRFHNGDHHDLATDAAEMMLNISVNLGKNWNFSTAAESVDSARQRILQADSMMANSDFLKTTLKDVVCIINGPHPNKPSSEYSMAALLDLKKLLQAAEKDALSNGMKQLNRSCFKCGKKLQFCISWLREYAEDLAETVPSLMLLEDISKLNLLAAIRKEVGKRDIPANCTEEKSEL